MTKILEHSENMLGKIGNSKAQSTERVTNALLVEHKVNQVIRPAEDGEARKLYDKETICILKSRSILQKLKTNTTKLSAIRITRVVFVTCNLY